MARLPVAPFLFVYAPTKFEIAVSNSIATLVQQGNCSLCILWKSPMNFCPTISYDDQQFFKRHCNNSLQILGKNNFLEIFLMLHHIFFFHASD